jgi:hypothetical protein
MRMAYEIMIDAKVAMITSEKAASATSAEAP